MQAIQDESGNIVIAQKPNPPLLVWLAATLLSLLPVEGNVQIGLDAIAFGAIFTWAWLELFQGVNLFRRALGLIVLLLAVGSRLQW
ncbi:MAG: hypothetical protein AAFQ89_14410 [Cyanobacteria bacterium J06626_18]